MSSVMDFLSSPLPLIAASLAVILGTFALIRLRARRFGGDQKKKRYHPLVTTFVSNLINLPRIYDYITKLANKHKTCRSLNLFRYEVLTVNPANVEYMVKTNLANYGKGLYYHNIMSDVFGDGIFTVDGEKWVHQRKVSSTEVATKVVRDFSATVFKTNALKLARIISETATCNQAIDIQDLFMKAALDSVVKVILGIDLDTIYGTNEEGAQFSNSFDLANEMTMYRFFDFSWKLKRLLNIGSEAVLRKNVTVIDQFIYKLIKSKSDAVHSSENVSPAPSKNGDIISRLLELKETDNPKYWRDLFFSLIVAGRDTTASTLSWFVYMLCKHPHIQEKIVKEIREATNLKDNVGIDELVDSVTEETIDRMQYLHAALTETLRLYPSVPLNVRDCLSDDTWPDGFNVRKGDMVGYSSYSMGRMKFLWGDDAQEFRPERWLNEDGVFQPESPFKFTAFNGGPRICLGKEFAYRELKIISVVLLSSFIFKLRDKNKVAHYSIKVSLHIEGGLYVQASPRLGFARASLS